MGVLEFTYKVIALLIGSFTTLMIATIISDYRLKERIKKEYKESKNFKEDK